MEVFYNLEASMKKFLCILLLLGIMTALPFHVIAEISDMIPTSSGIMLPKNYFESVARLTLTSGDYVNWTVKDKRSIVLLMIQYGFIDTSFHEQALSGAEQMIDELMLSRYGVPAMANDLSVISLMRIATVELGSYTEWPNETWVWFSHMMLDLGLWNENTDVDIYETPGKEAIVPEEAVALARNHLLVQGIFDENMVKQARIVWHYMTHASDIQRKHLEYHISFYFGDGSVVYVSVTPQGKIE